MALAQAMLGNPDLMLLDEPTTGVDPEQRVSLRQVLSRAGECSTVLLSTHQTEDVAALCDRVVVLDQGHVRFDGAVVDLIDRFLHRRHRRHWCSSQSRAAGGHHLAGVLPWLVGGLRRPPAGPVHGRLSEAVEASPADGVIRTGALCLACLVPGAVALGWTACMSLVMALKAVPVSAALSSADRGAMIAASVVYAVGGPLFGVLVGRWTHFPGAGLVAAVVLVAWTFLGTFGLLMPASRLGTLIHLNAPYTTWVSSDGPNAPLWLAGGSPWWYLAYIAALCGLAATAAMFHEAVGTRRSRLSGVLAVLAVLAVASLLMAAAPDPTRLTL